MISTPTPGSSPAAPLEPTATTEPQATPTPRPDWGGTWVMFYFQPDHSATVELVLSRNAVTGVSVSESNETLKMTGTVSSDGQQVSGIWENVTFGTTGGFEWRFVPGNGNQFEGHASDTEGNTADVYGTPYGWCGYRPGSSQPDNCAWH